MNGLLSNWFGVCGVAGSILKRCREGDSGERMSVRDVKACAIVSYEQTLNAFCKDNGGDVGIWGRVVSFCRTFREVLSGENKKSDDWYGGISDGTSGKLFGWSRFL